MEHPKKIPPEMRRDFPEGVSIFFSRYITANYVWQISAEPTCRAIRINTENRYGKYRNSRKLWFVKKFSVLLKHILPSCFIFAYQKRRK
ncbi:hypothetical protein VF13_42315 [Nostoc linckia z16]|nr:hypothetical protein VF13_42315 [Nostoc linckia z16]